jgi:lysophospholipase L1-like esterase
MTESESYQPGRLVRSLALVHPGVRRIARQIEQHAETWRALNAQTLAGAAPDAPLWLAIGDSTAQGVGTADIDGGYVLQLRTALGVRRDPRLASLAALPLVNLSVSGARARDVLLDQILRAVALDRPFGLVTCTIGSNDLMRDPAGRARPELARVVTALAELGAPMTVVATLPHAAVSVAGRLANNTIRAQARRDGVVVADVRGAVGSWIGKVGADGFHPNERGYAGYATAFARAIEAAARERDALSPGVDAP